MHALQWMATANQKTSLLGFDDLWWDVTVSRNVIIQNGNDQMCFTPRTSTWATCSGIQFEISTGSGVCTNNIIVGNAGSGILQFDSNNMTVLNNLIATNMASTNGNDTSLNGGLGDNIALEFQACSGRQYNENRYENGTMPSVLWPSYGCGLPPTTDAATFKNWLVAGNILQGGLTTGGWLVGDNRTGCKHMCNNTAVGNAVNGQSRTGGGRLIEERDNTQTTINASINLNALELRLVVGKIVQGQSPVIAANVLDFYGRPRIIGRVTAGPFQSLVQGKVNILKLWPIFDEGGYVPWEWLGNDGGRKSSLKADDSIVGPQNPLAGLPALPTPHHSYGMCSHWAGFPSSECGFPADSNNPLQVDFARITHSWAVDIGPIYLDHNASGVSIWNQSKVNASQNRSEIVEAVRLCAKANASISINYSPWGDWWNTYLPRRWNNRRSIDTCPDNVGEEQELRYYRFRFASISKWIMEINAELGTSVSVGAVLLDSETYRSKWCCLSAIYH